MKYLMKPHTEDLKKNKRKKERKNKEPNENSIVEIHNN